MHSKEWKDQLYTKPTIRKTSRPIAIIIIVMRIFVETQNAETMTLNVEQEDTVRNVKERIKSVKKVPVEEQTLRYNGVDLKDDETLEKRGVYRDATLQVLIEVRRSTTMWLSERMKTVLLLATCNITMSYI